MKKMDREESHVPGTHRPPPPLPQPRGSASDDDGPHLSLLVPILIKTLHWRKT